MHPLQNLNVIYLQNRFEFRLHCTTRPLILNFFGNVDEAKLLNKIKADTFIWGISGAMSLDA